MSATMIGGKTVLLGASPGASYLFGNGTAAAPSIAFQSDPTTGLYKGATTLNASVSGALSLQIASNGQIYGGTVLNSLQLAATGAVNLTAAGNQNITLTPSGTGWVQLGTSGSHQIRTVSGELTLHAQGGRVILSASSGVAQYPGINLFNTSTNSGNGRIQLADHSSPTEGIGFGTGANDVIYKRLAGVLRSPVTWEANQFTAIQDGSATAPTFRFLNNTQTGLYLVSNGIGFTTNGTLALTLDASQNAAFTGRVQCGTSSAHNWLSRSAMFSPADGNIMLQNFAGTGFDRLQFGGTTSSFPALKRVGAALRTRFADDSGDCAFGSGPHYVLGAAGTAASNEVCYGGTTASTVGAAGGASALPATPLGYIIVNVAGTTAKIPYYNN